MLRIITILLCCNFPLQEATSIYNLSKEAGDVFNFNLIITKIYLERKIEKTIIIKNQNDDTTTCPHGRDTKIRNLNSTVMLLERKGKCEKQLALGDMFIIYFLPETFELEYLDTFVYCLGRKRDTRILFIWCGLHNRPNAEVQDELLQQQQHELFEYCKNKRLINVISIYRDYEIDGHFYTYTNFPEFQLERKTLKEPCFPDRMKDLKGASIRVVPDQLEPWSMAWRDPDGSLRVGGYITKILEAFIRRVNGTLVYPVPIKPNDSLTAAMWLSLLKNDTVDIVAGTAPASIFDVGHDVSSVLQPVDWNIMLPFQTIADSDLISYIINSIVGAILLLFLIIFSLVLTLEGLLWRLGQRQQTSITYSFRFLFWVFINVVLRNVFGLSTCMKIRPAANFVTHFLYVLLFFCGIFMSTLISAALNSYLTSPLQHPRITTLHELANAGLKVKTSQFEYDIIHLYVNAEDVPRLRKKIFIPMKSLVELREQHSNLDVRFGFTVLSSNWDVIDRYQSYLPKPLFYVSKELFLAKALPMSIPIQRHSIFKESLSDMINSIHSSGLTELWTSQAYDDMVAAKLLNITTHAKKARENIIDLKYLYWLWWFYGIGVCSASLVFCAELWFYKRMERHKLNRWRQTFNEHFEWTEEEELTV